MNFAERSESISIAGLAQRVYDSVWWSIQNLFKDGIDVLLHLANLARKLEYLLRLYRTQASMATKRTLNLQFSG